MLSLFHFGINTFARAMGKRAQFNFMFTDSTAKHFYGSVASMGFIIVHTTHGCFCFFFLSFFLLLLAVPFCCRLFYPAKNYVYFIFSRLPQSIHSLVQYSSLSFAWRLTVQSFRSSTNLCTLFCALRSVNTMRPA